MATKMDKKLKREWVKELRDPKRKQGTGAMCMFEDGEFYFCCLGVLVDIAHDGEWERISVNQYRSEACGSGMPTEMFLSSVGLDPGIASDLASMNDEGASFAKIADRIESDPDL